MPEPGNYCCIRCTTTSSNSNGSRGSRPSPPSVQRASDPDDRRLLVEVDGHDSGRATALAWAVGDPPPQCRRQTEQALRSGGGREGVEPVVQHQDGVVGAAPEACAAEPTWPTRPERRV